MLSPRLSVLPVLALIVAGCSGSPAPTSNAPSSDAEAGRIYAGPASQPEEPLVLPRPDTPEAPEARPREVVDPSSLLGRWNGPEGLFLEISRGEATNTVRLRLKDNLDDEATYDGLLVGEEIRFERTGHLETITRGTGAQTGYSALRSRSDCLIVKTGAEGYCR